MANDYQHKPGNGSLFAGDKDKPAAWSGKVCLPDGTMAFIDLYRATDRDTGEPRKDKNGVGWYNVRIKPMQSQGGEAPRQNDKFSTADLDDDLPF